jgi:hypothetical protein
MMSSGPPQGLKPACLFELDGTTEEAAKNSSDGIECPSAAKAGIENVAVIAAVSRCANQSKRQIKFFRSL